MQEIVAKPALDAVGDPNVRLSMCMPTNRAAHMALPTIVRIIGEGLPAGVELVISDNSGDPGKREQIEKICAQHTNVRAIFPTDAAIPWDNFIAAFAASRGQLIAFVSDDDVFLPEHFSYCQNFLETHPGYNSASGALCLYTPGVGSRIVENKEYARGWGDRVVDYLFRNTPGPNLLFYGMHRRTVVAGCFEYVRQHPLVDSFFDFHLSVWSLMHGCGHIGRQGLYLYDDVNWGTADARWDTRAKHYRRLGLPDWFAGFHDLYRAVEYYLFIGGRFTSHPAAERELVAGHVRDRYFAMWVRGIDYAMPRLPAPVAALVRENLPASGRMEPRQVIAMFFTVLAEANPVVADRYANYFVGNIDM